MTVTINIVGAGKLGKTIGRLIVKNKLAKIGGVFTRSLASCEPAIQFIGDGKYYSKLSLLPSADITFMTTPDDKISDTALEIARFGNVQPGNIFVHCSGVLTSEVMSAVKIKNGLVVSIHPMKSFSNPEIAVENYSGTFCAMEGDPDAVEVIESMFKSFGSIVFKIDRDKKSLYHAASVFASNYLVTLAEKAVSCLHEVGVQEDMALKMIMSLMKGTLFNIEQLMSPKDALTGPIKRGDISTVNNHMSAFSNEKTKFLYSILGKATLDLTTHDSGVKEQMQLSLSLIKWSDIFAAFAAT